jgi:iron complex outermembrane receptor protein
MKKLNVASVIGLLVSGSTLAVYADEAASPAEGRRAGNLILEEVVVTSRKKAVAESLQNISVAASAYGGDQLDALFVRDLRALSDMIPNTELKDSGTLAGAQNYFIRGMGLNGSVPSDEPTVGVIQDGIYWGVNYGASPEAYDLESIEVLRGPQGTLFGRNVTGGAVNIRSARADYETTYGFKLSAGSFGRFDAAAHLGGTLIDETLAGRISYQSRNQNDGYVDNLVTGNKFGEQESSIFRGSLRWDVLENLDVTVIAEHYEDDSDSGVAYGIDAPGTPSDALGFVAPDDDWDIKLDTEGFSEAETDLFVIDTTWDIGHGLVTSITGYRAVEYSTYADFDGTDIPLLNMQFNMDQDQLSQEIRYASTFSDNFDFTVGLYYFTQDWEYSDQRWVFAQDIFVATRSLLENDTTALFASLDYHINESWTVNIGGRYTQEEKDAEAAPLGFCDFDNPDVCTFTQADDEDWTSFSPALSATYRISADSIVYASYNAGFRSGGFNLRGGLSSPYGEETVDAFEMGYKSDFLDNRVRLNAATFYNEYQDLQRTAVIPETIIQTTRNAAEATIQGLELELTVQLTEGLILNMVYGYTDASYDEFNGFDLDGDNIPDPEAKNLDFAQVAENNGMIAFTYETQMFDWGSIVSNVRYSFSDGYFIEERNNPNLEQGSYSIVNASVQWVSPDAKWTMALIGSNLTDEKYYGSGFDTGLSHVVFGNRPRAWAVEVAYRL